MDTEKVESGKKGNKRDANDAEIEEENKLLKKQKVVVEKEEFSGDEDSSSDDEKPKVQAKTAPAPAAAKKKRESSDDESDSKDEPKTPATPQAQRTGEETKKVFAGNLSLCINKQNMVEFFEQAGEIADVLLFDGKDGRFNGFGCVEFVTEEGAKEAVKLNGQKLLGRPVYLERGDMGDRGAFTPQSGGYQKPQGGGTIRIQGFDTSSEFGEILLNHFNSCGEFSTVCMFKEGITFIEYTDAESFGKALRMNNSKLGTKYLEVDTQGGTIKIRGFDTSSGIDEIQSSLVNHFEPCGEILNVHIPKGRKGTAFMSFPDAKSFCEALFMDKSKLGTTYLDVDGSRPRICGPRGGGRGKWSSFRARAWGSAHSKCV